MGLLEAKEERLDMVQEKIFREPAEIFRDISETKQNVKEEIALSGKDSGFIIQRW